MFKDVGQCQKTQLIPRTFLKIYIGQCPNDAKSYATIIYILYLGQNRKSKLVSTALFYIFSGRVFSSSLFFSFFFPFFFFFPISGSVFTGQANSFQKAWVLSSCPRKHGDTNLHHTSQVTKESYEQTKNHHSQNIAMAPSSVLSRHLCCVGSAQWMAWRWGWCQSWQEQTLYAQRRPPRKSLSLLPV